MKGFPDINGRLSDSLVPPPKGSSNSIRILEMMIENHQVRSHSLKCPRSASLLLPIRVYFRKHPNHHYLISDERKKNKMLKPRLKRTQKAINELQLSQYLVNLDYKKLENIIISYQGSTVFKMKRVFNVFPLIKMVGFKLEFAHYQGALRNIEMGGKVSSAEGYS